MRRSIFRLSCESGETVETRSLRFFLLKIKKKGGD